MRITLPDGSVREYAGPVTGRQVAESIGAGLAKAAVGVKVDGQLMDLNRRIDHDVAVSIITRPRKGTPVNQQDPDALYLVRHSAAHVMAEAIQRLWPNAQLAYGPPVETGFFYDIALDTPISSDDFSKIEAEMEKIIGENRPFNRYELDPKLGFEKLEREGNKYKKDNARRALEAGSKCLSWYITGEKPWMPDNVRAAGYPDDVFLSQWVPSEWQWEDLCMGPHVPSTGYVGAFKVTNVASSHWHGDVTSDRFQRVYGTAFYTKEDLDAYLRQLDEAKQRDHRVIGQKLGLFLIDEMVGPGLVLWKPRGASIRTTLQNFLLDELTKRGYDQVYTPNIGKLELYRTSGHYPYYADSQFRPIYSSISSEKLNNLWNVIRIGAANPDEYNARVQIALTELRYADPKLHDELKHAGGSTASAGKVIGYFDRRDHDEKVLRGLLEQSEDYLLKPMNCPHHIRIFASDPHSYRDLPVRLAEFGTVYRYEQSGELTGMTRVRGFTQDDAHIFCTNDQVKDEFRSTVELVQFVFGTFGFADVSIRLSLRDRTSDKYTGAPELWDRAEDELRRVLQDMAVPFVEAPGEAAFYGPKVDFIVRDVIGRPWQLGTVQLDYNLPERFKIEYIGADNRAHRPVMIHRAPFGSMERFMAILIEHYAGAFPLWLAPEQVRVLPISDKFMSYAQKVHAALKQVGLRAAVDATPERVQAKIRTAQEAKIPYMLVVGGKDEAAGAVSVRDRSRGDLGAMPLEQFIQQARHEADSRGGATVQI